ncbi:MAG: NAD-dependent epimerase/dehydratase family protein [Methylophilaceae bacterium]|nr:NAD-dependent epimerase/dehydratase family protein [Methylophilaceae bacterium]
MQKHPTHILIAGCGDLGCALAALLLNTGHKVSALRRSDSALPHGAQSLRGDVTQPATLQNLAALKPDILVYCASASAQTDDSYRAIYVDGLRNVLAELNNSHNLRHVFFVSSTRVYGQPSDELLNENCPAQAADFGGERLLQAEHLLKNLLCPGTALRLSGIYGPGRERMLKLARQPQSWPQKNTWSNRIHRDDAAAFIAFLIERVINMSAVNDCYIVTDNQPATQYEVLLWLAAQLAIDTNAVTVPPITGGKRLSNAKMRACGFELRYKNFKEGYGELLQDTGD